MSVRILSVFGWAGKIVIPFAIFAYFLYVNLGLIGNLEVIHERYKLARLNYIMPAFEDLLNLISQDSSSEDFAPKRIMQFVRYYSTVAKFIPENSGAYGMLGFFYYQLGDFTQSIDSYQRAVELNPEYFWFHFNLGLIYFENEDYEHAVISLQKAVTTNIDRSLFFLHTGKVYQPFLARMKTTFHARLLRGYQHAYVLLTLSYQRLNRYQEMLISSRYALSVLPASEKSVFYLFAGRAAYEIQQYSQSLSLLKEYLIQHPAHADAIKYLGLNLRAMGRKNMSELQLKRAHILEQSSTARVDFFPEFRVQIF